MQFPVYTIGCLVCLFVMGCASSPNVYEQTQNNLSGVVDEMYRAAKENNADKLYGFLSENVQNNISKPAFRQYFDQNQSYIVDYLLKLRDETQIQPFAIHANLVGDPCDSLSMKLNETGQWIINQVPGRNVSDSSEKRKSLFLQSIKTQNFILLINTYSYQHPEISPLKIRQIQRGLIQLDESHISFEGPVASISFDEDAMVTMICTTEGWVLKTIS